MPSLRQPAGRPSLIGMAPKGRLARCHPTDLQRRRRRAAARVAPHHDMPDGALRHGQRSGQHVYLGG